MIAVVERVLHASVTVEGETVGSIGAGLLVRLGIAENDTINDLEYIVRKIAGLRIFPQNGRMTLSVADTGGQILIVSQFTLLGDARHGMRPDFARAARPEHALELYEKCIAALKAKGLVTASGEFGAHMQVHACGDGPVTILLDSMRSF